MTSHEDDRLQRPDAADPAIDPALREALESRLTAHALDQLDGDDRAAIEVLLADPGREEARRTVAELRTLAAALKAGRLADGPGRSADLRRAVVAAVAGATPAPVTMPPVIRTDDRPRRRSWNRWFAVAGTLSAAVLVTTSVFQWGTIAGRPKWARDIAARADRSALQKQAEAVAAPAPQAAAAGPAAVSSARPEPAASVAESRPRRAAAPPPMSMPPLRAAEEAANAMRDTGGKMAAGGIKSRNTVENSVQNPLRPPFDNARAPAAAVKPLVSPEAPRASAMRAGEMSARELEQTRDRERYDQFAEHRFRSPADAPLSTFSIDVDTASYANVRRFLTAGRLPPPDAVRIEELVNYFRYDYPQPVGDDPFAVALEVADCPWHTGHKLVRVGLQGRTVDRTARPAGNLVFLVDVSGSMGAPDKLPLVKQALAMLVEELTESDSVAIVTYAGNAGVRLPSTSGDQKGRILEAIESLVPGGSTHGSAGITLAYEQAAEGFIEGGANRVILATDGDLNVGITSDADLVELIKRQAKGGTFLTVLGFGTGNLQDAKMEKLSANGNGVYAYIDSAREARKVLVEQLTGSTITIAKDVKIQVEFNPAEVASYRLLGYENRTLAAQDFRDDRKDAGEIGAGHGVTALYEIALVDEAGGTAPAGAEPLKYQPQPEPARPAPRVDPRASRELLTVKLRFKQPEGSESVLREVPLAERGGEFAAASADLRFAAAVAAFGMILRGSPEKGEATLPLVASIAGAALGGDAGGYRAEFLDLVRKAQALRHE